MQHLDYLARRLLSPSQQAEHKAAHLAQLRCRLEAAASRSLQYRHQQLLRLQQNLQHLNPQSVLIRGYALVETTDGQVIHSQTQLAIGQEVRLTLAEGSAEAEIKAKHG
jgi:exodeoxyribonuclease VII large subunit